MPSVIEFPAGRAFQFTFYTHYLSAPDQVWTNNIKLLSRADGTLADLKAAGRSLAEGLMQFHFDLVQTSKWRVSTAAHEVPHLSDQFYEESYPVFGARDSTGQSMLDKRIVLWLSKTAGYGRLGKMFLRGCLSEQDIEANAGSMALSTQGRNAATAALQGAMQQWAGYLGFNDLATLVWLMEKKDGSDRRIVVALGVNGVTTNKWNKGWFDRGPNQIQSVVPPNEVPPAYNESPYGDWYSEYSA